MADVLPVTPVPRTGDLFVDARGDGRMMRVSLHPERGLVVVSLWTGASCRASFQLPLDDAARLAELVGPRSSAETDTGQPIDPLAEIAPGPPTVLPDLPQAS